MSTAILPHISDSGSIPRRVRPSIRCTGLQPSTITAASRNTLTAPAWTLAVRFLALNARHGQAFERGADTADLIVSHLSEAVGFLQRKHFQPLAPFCGLRNAFRLKVHGGEWPIEAALAIRFGRSTRRRICWAYNITASTGLELKANGIIEDESGLEQTIWGFLDVLTTAASIAAPE